MQKGRRREGTWVGTSQGQRSHGHEGCWCKGGNINGDKQDIEGKEGGDGAEDGEEKWFTQISIHFTPVKT